MSFLVSCSTAIPKKYDGYYTKSYRAYVRDFSVISPEEIIEERLNLIKDYYNE